MTLVSSRTACACTHGEPDACHFRIAWSINPHMQVGAGDPDRACAQHRAYLQALRDHGARILQLPFLHGAYDSVFVKDSAILMARDGAIRALPATPRHAVRRDEPKARARQLARAGIAVAPPLDSPLEGGDVVVLEHRRIALLGHGIRSLATSAPGLASFLGCEVVPLALRDPALFHLDTALAVLGDDTLLYCEAAFMPGALRTIARLGFRKTVSIPPDVAMQFALNFVEVGSAIVTGTDSPAMARVWRSLGRSCVVAPLDEFQLAGGSAACLVARVHDLDAAAARIAA